MSVPNGVHLTLFLSFLRELSKKGIEKHGLYTLYDKHGRPLYVGKASDLKSRILQHHVGKIPFDQLALYILNRGNISEVEAILINVVRPEYNERKGKLSGDLKKALRDFMREESEKDFELALNPDTPKSKKIQHETKKRLTPKKLKNYIDQYGQMPLAKVLEVTPGRISQLYTEDDKKLSSLIKYILQGGQRHKIIELIEGD